MRRFNLLIATSHSHTNLIGVVTQLHHYTTVFRGADWIIRFHRSIRCSAMGPICHPKTKNRFLCTLRYPGANLLLLRRRWKLHFTGRCRLKIVFLWGLLLTRSSGACCCEAELHVGPVMYTLNIAP